MEEFDAQAGEVVQLLQVEVLPETVHEAVLRVQPEAHGPQDLRAFLAQVLKGAHQLVQVRMSVDHVGSQDVVEAVRGTRETLLRLLTPGQLRHLGTHQRLLKCSQRIVLGSDKVRERRKRECFQCHSSGVPGEYTCIGLWCCG